MRVVAIVSVQLLSIIHNAADLERSFSDLGQLLSSTQVNLSMCSIKHTDVNSADMRK